MRLARCDAHWAWGECGNGAAREGDLSRPCGECAYAVRSSKPNQALVTVHQAPPAITWIAFWSFSGSTQNLWEVAKGETRHRFRQGLGGNQVGIHDAVYEFAILADAVAKNTFAVKPHLLQDAHRRRIPGKDRCFKPRKGTLAF